jgi:CheY-like chemotaxis protein
MAVRRVLVVEDHEDGGESLRMMLELSGYEVRIARTGTEGVALARQWLPDAVISDIGLPGLDGFGVARALRGDPVTAHIPLLAMSGYGDEASRRKAEQSGFAVLFTKPVDPAMLLEALGKLNA